MDMKPKTACYHDDFARLSPVWNDSDSHARQARLIIRADWYAIGVPTE